jgi:hypothetical protein
MPPWGAGRRGGRRQSEGEEGRDVAHGEADGTGDPADLLGQRAGFDHRRDLLQIWKQSAASATPNSGNSGGKLATA